MVLIGEDESFSLTANVESAGFIRMVLSGGIVRRTASGTYVAGLLPQMFLGADGTQLSSWRQYIPSAGSQVILRKPAGELLVPKEELYWRKVAEPSAVPSVGVRAVGFNLVNLVWIVPVVALFGYLAYKGLTD